MVTKPSIFPVQIKIQNVAEVLACAPICFGLVVEASAWNLWGSINVTPSNKVKYPTTHSRIHSAFFDSLGIAFHNRSKSIAMFVFLVWFVHFCKNNCRYDVTSSFAPKETFLLWVLFEGWEGNTLVFWRCLTAIYQCHVFVRIQLPRHALVLTWSSRFVQIMRLHMCKFFWHGQRLRYHSELQCSFCAVSFAQHPWLTMKRALFTIAEMVCTRPWYRL